MATKSQTIESGAKGLPANLIVWDAHDPDGHPLTHQSLIEHKAVLGVLVRPTPYLRVIDSIDGLAEALFDATQAQRLEGIVAKRRTYRCAIGERGKD